MVHGTLYVLHPDLTTQVAQHQYMFFQAVPPIDESLRELFPGLDNHDSMALAMDGLSDGYMRDDPANPGHQIVDTFSDNWAQSHYGQNINQAVVAAGQYRAGTKGTPFC